MKKYMLLSAALLLFTASCSNDENNNEQKEPTQTVQFSFINEDFGEDETPTRTAETAKPQIVDLGDCEAEISVESEPAAKTRGALTPANGHYTIRAYQAGTLKGEMSGTFSGGTFTPDASSSKKLNLPYGTYDFVAFNDDVTVSGTNLTTPRAKAETARMGFATVNITSPTPIYVLFTMKHVGCRLRTQFFCPKDIPNNITATLEATAASVIPVNVSYNPATKAFTGTSGAMATEINNSPASTEPKYYGTIYYPYGYTSTSDYHYFLPTTAGSHLKLNFSAGTIFWKPMNNVTIPQLSTTFLMEAGKSYLIRIKLNPNYTYLMSDGSTGFFRDTTFGGGTKTPIAVVINQDKRIAVALQDANGGNICPWTTQSNYQSYFNTYIKMSFEDALAWENGYEETWDPGYSTSNVTGNQVKGNNPNFPPFKACADYNPGVTVTGANVSKWYLPAYGEYKYLFTTLGFEPASKISGVGDMDCYGNLINTAFTKVGGARFDHTKWYWSSTEQGNGEAERVSPRSMSVNWNYNLKNLNNLVRAFVKY